MTGPGQKVRMEAGKNRAKAMQRSSDVSKTRECSSGVTGHNAGTGQGPNSVSRR